MSDTIIVTRWKDGDSDSLILKGNRDTTKSQAMQYFDGGNDPTSTEEEWTQERFDQLKEFQS